MIIMLGKKMELHMFVMDCGQLLPWPGIPYKNTSWFVNQKSRLI